MERIKGPVKMLSLALSIMLMFALCACGATNAPSDTVSEEAESNRDNGTSQEDQSYSSTEDLSLGTPSKASDEESTITQPNTDKIIYTGSADIETQNFKQTLADIERLVSEIGGFIQSSYVQDNDFYTAQYGGKTYRTACYELRIPVEKFDGVMNELSSLGNVPYSSVNAENITEQYTDTQARMTSSKAEESRLLELLDKANTVDEMLQIESHLSDIRYEIEHLSSLIKNWDSHISYSTLTLNVSEVSLYTEETPAGMNYGKQLSTALISSSKSVWRFLKDMLKFIVAALPILVVISVIAVPVLFIIRGALRKKKANQTHKDKDKPEE